MEMERFNGRAKAEDRGAVALVLDLRRPSVFLWCGPGRRTSASQGRYWQVLCGFFEHQRRVQFDGCVAEPLKTITAILPGLKWSCLLLHIVLLDALSEVTKNYPSTPLKLRVFVDDIMALEKGRNQEVAEMAKK